MKSRLVRATTPLSAAALVLGLIALPGVTSPLHAAAASGGATGQQAAAPAPAAGKDDNQAMMAAYEAMAKPGEHHKRLGTLVGRWTMTGKGWMAPGQPPIEMSSTMEASWVLDGHYLREAHHGSFLGKPFEGMALDGYDNVAHEYFSTWVDNMGTGVLDFRGTCDDPCKTLNLVAEGIDPMSGKKMKERETTTFIDADTFRFEMYMVGAGPDGQDVKMMEFEAKRVH
jgi:hypothetical protein